MNANIIQLPELYKGRRIVRRVPYTMYADKNFPATSGPTNFSDSSFQHNVDHPFEVLDALPNVTAIDGSNYPIATPSKGTINCWVKLQVNLVGLAIDLMKAAQRISALVDKNEGVWAFGSPLYLEKSHGFSVAVTNDIASGDAAGGIRLELSFRGSLLMLE